MGNSCVLAWIRNRMPQPNAEGGPKPALGDNETLTDPTLCYVGSPRRRPVLFCPRDNASRNGCASSQHSAASGQDGQLSNQDFLGVTNAPTDAV